MKDEHKSVFIKGTVFMAVVLLLGCVTSGQAFAGAIPEGLMIQSAYAPGVGMPVGKIRAVYGKTFVMHADRQAVYMAQAGLAVYEDDTLATRVNGRIVLVLNDESVLTLGPNTEMVLDQSVFDPGANNRSVLVNLLTGKARFFVKKFAALKNSTFKVRTATSVAAVRGSDFIIEQVGDKIIITTLGQTVLEVSNPNFPLAAPVVVNSFEQLIVAIGQLPGNPIQITEAELRAILEALQIPGEADPGASDDDGDDDDMSGETGVPMDPPSFPEPARPVSPYAP